MKLKYFEGRCWDKGCRKSETCARYLQRKDSSPATGHHSSFCGPSLAGYIEEKIGEHHEKA